MARYVVRLAKSAGLVILFVVAAVLGSVTGVVFAFAGDLPQISALDDYAPSTITRVFGAHGDVVGEFSTQRRVVIPYEAISPKLRQAIIAALEHGSHSASELATVTAMLPATVA